MPVEQMSFLLWCVRRRRSMLFFQELALLDLSVNSCPTSLKTKKKKNRYSLLRKTNWETNANRLSADREKTTAWNGNDTAGRIANMTTVTATCFHHHHQDWRKVEHNKIEKLYNPSSKRQNVPLHCTDMLMMTSDKHVLRGLWSSYISSFFSFFRCIDSWLKRIFQSKIIKVFPLRECGLKKKKKERKACADDFHLRAEMCADGKIDLSHFARPPFNNTIDYGYGL